MKSINFFWCFVCLSACNSLNGVVRHDWSELQPYVVSVTHETESEVDSPTELWIEFSHPLAADSLTEEAVFLMSQTDFANYDEDWREMVDDIEDGDVSIWPVSLILSADHKQIQITCDETVLLSGDYVLVVTPKLLSDQRVPLNQALTGGETTFYTGYFSFSTSEESVEPAENPDEATQDQSPLAEGSESPDVQAETPTDNPPADDAVVQADAPAAGEGPSEAFLIEGIRITEVVTDPQQDFNDTLGGNGVAFDIHIGSGTVGSTDEYVEIYNATNQSLDVSSWSVVMEDGTDVTQTLQAWSQVHFSEEGNLTNFAGGEFLVLGDPEGQLNNTVGITLLDASGEVVDSVWIDDANADSLADEAYALDFETGDWLQTEASPGF